MKTFQWTMRLLAMIPLVTGLLEVTMGMGSLRTVGVVLPDALAHLPSADNNWRFLGTVWMGYAALVVYAVSDPYRHASWLRILLGILFLSGVARATSVVLMGWPVPTFIAAMALELLVMPLMALWHARLVQRPV